MSNENLFVDEIFDNKKEKFVEILMKEEIKEEKFEDQNSVSDENEERFDFPEENRGNVTTQTVAQNCLHPKIECPPANFVVDGLLQSNSEAFVRDGREKLKKKRRTIGKHYKCRFCSYKATRLGNLEIHERTHTGERPFKCSTCPYKTTRMGNLKQHQRIHTGEKPFKCSTCPYEAAQMGNLKRHKRTHNRDSQSTQRVPMVAKDRLRVTLSNKQGDKGSKATIS